MNAKYILTTLIVTAALSACTQSQEVEIRVTPPLGFSAKDKVHVVGAFNNWVITGEGAQELSYRDGVLSTKITTEDDNVFFTFVKNQDWQNMPASKFGKGLCNYHHRLTSESSVVNVSIPAWKPDKPTEQAPSTITGHIERISGFKSDQLDREMDILVYLPNSYQSNKDKTYPVLYMLDGQNVFDSASAYSDEWQVDEIMSQLEQQGKVEAIVVAVPNSADRWQEYNPWDFVNWSGEAKTGKGQLTIDFIKNSLKPYLDNKYRTNKQNTGLAGSSLGGLMALYAAMEHSDTFNFVAAFSPSLSIENTEGNNVLFEALKDKKMADSKVYFDMGKPEYGDYSKAEQLNHSLLKAFGEQSEHIKFVKDDIGRHCELDWSKRFPEAITWLLAAN